MGDRADEDLAGAFAAEAQPAATDAEQAGTARLQDLQSAAGADAQLGHATDPGRFAANVVDFAPFAGAEQFERQEGGVHRGN